MPFGPANWARRPDLPDLRVSAGGSALPVTGAMSIGNRLYIPYRTNLISVIPDDGMVYIGGGMAKETDLARIFSYSGGAEPTTGSDGGTQGSLTLLRRDGPHGRLANIGGVPFALIGGHSVAFNATLAKSGPGKVLIAAAFGMVDELGLPLPEFWTKQADLFEVPAKDFGIGGAGFMSLDGSFFQIGPIWYCMFGLIQGTGGAGGSSETRHAAIWSTEDLGETWSLLRDLSAIPPWNGTSQPARVIGVNRSGLERIVAVLGNSSVWYSDNLGASWTESGGNNVNAQDLILLDSGGILLGRSGGLSVSTGANVSCDLGENFSQGVTQPGGNNNTRLGVAQIGLEEMVAGVPGGTGVRLFWSNNGGEDFLFQGEFTPISNTSPLMDMLFRESDGHPYLYNQGRQAIQANQQPLGTVSARSICPGIAAGLANAGKLVVCGSPVLGNTCP